MTSLRSPAVCFFNQSFSQVKCEIADVLCQKGPEQKHGLVKDKSMPNNVNSSSVLTIKPAHKSLYKNHICLYNN